MFACRLIGLEEKGETPYRYKCKGKSNGGAIRGAKAKKFKIWLVFVKFVSPTGRAKCRAKMALAYFGGIPTGLKCRGKIEI